METPFNGTGTEVEISRIDKELGLLWDASGDTKTRASLINLVIHSEDPASLPANTALIEEIAECHACRAILIQSNPHLPRSSARAWIGAHCRLVGKGERQVCSEQITFLLEGPCATSLPGIVFSHLDSDLPLCLWWQGKFQDPPDPKLWAWVDRLIFDSADWAHPLTQFSIVRQIASLAGGNRTVLCDLNWTRLHAWRTALASLFDHAAALPHLRGIRKLHIAAGSDAHTSAWLLVGWLADRLDWIRPHQTSSHVTEGTQRTTFIAPDGFPIACDLSPSDQPGLVGIALASANASFSLERSKPSAPFTATLHTPQIGETHLTLRSRCENLPETLATELGRAGRHPLYLRSLAHVS